MSLVLALFDDPKTLEDAIDRVNDAGFGDDVVDVEDRSGAGASAPSPAGAAMPGGQALAGGQRAAAVPLDRNAFEPYLSRAGEAGQYFKDALEHGARLLILDTGRAEEAAAVLEEAGAQRVYQA